MKRTAIFICLIALAGCKKSPNETKLTYMPDMADAPTAKAQRTYLDPPDGAVTRNAILYPKTVEESEDILVSPYQEEPSGDVLAQGEKLYSTYCTVCHGPSAKGGGSIQDKFPAPPDITGEAYQKRKDGFYFYRVTFGTALMPSYGHATSAKERWQIVAYLRKLQKAVPQ